MLNNNKRKQNKILMMREPGAGALDLEDDAESDPELLSDDLKSASHTIMDMSVTRGTISHEHQISVI